MTNKLFYLFDRKEIIEATSSEYRKFLKQAGYANIDRCSGLLIEKNILRNDQSVKDSAKYLKIKLNENDDCVVNINQSNGRRLIKKIGGKLLTTQLMYGLFIPFLIDQLAQGNKEVQSTIDEMTDTKAEWLEDLILDKSRLRIGSQEKKLTLVGRDGYFDKSDLNEFGYPTKIKDSGEYYYWYPRNNEIAAFRDWDSELDLDLNWGPSFVSVRLGVRLAKFL